MKNFSQKNMLLSYVMWVPCTHACILQHASFPFSISIRSHISVISPTSLHTKKDFMSFTGHLDSKCVVCVSVGFDCELHKNTSSIVYQIHTYFTTSFLFPVLYLPDSFKNLEASRQDRQAHSPYFFLPFLTTLLLSISFSGLSCSELYLG